MVDPLSVRYLCMGPGGANGWIFIGILQAFERELMEHDRSLHSQIKGVSGASVGSIIGMAVILGFTAVEFREFAKELMNTYQKRMTTFNILEFRSKKGLLDPMVIRDVIRDMIERKLGKDHREDTLLQLHQQTNKHFVAAAYNISYERGEFIDHLSAPGLEVGVAVAMSCAIPAIFQHVEYNGSAYVDAAIDNSLPIEPFDMNQTLACNVVAHHDYVRPKDMSMADTFCRVTHIVYNMVKLKIDSLPKHQRERVLTIDVPCLIGTVVSGFQLSETERDHMISAGVSAGLSMFHRNHAVGVRMAAMLHTLFSTLRPRAVSAIQASPDVSEDAVDAPGDPSDLVDPALDAVGQPGGKGDAGDDVGDRVEQQPPLDPPKEVLPEGERLG